MHENPASEGVQIKNNLKKIHFAQQSSNTPSGVPYQEGDKGSKIPNIIDLVSTGLRRAARLANKPKQKYGLFAKFYLSVIVSCEVDKNPHIFLTRSYQHI